MRKQEQQAVNGKIVKTTERAAAPDYAKKVLLILDVVSFSLMLAGFTAVILGSSHSTIPGPALLALPDLLKRSNGATGMQAMSAGILLFACLPSLRVLMGMEHFARRGEVINLIAALIVLTELMVSILV